MKIEESFRDIKSYRFGFALTLARARRITRMHVLLLIAALAILVAIRAGLATKAADGQDTFKPIPSGENPCYASSFLGENS